MPPVDPEATAPAERPAAEPDPGRPANPEATATGPRSEPAVLPDITADERDIGWGEHPEPADDDRYLREVPPHHGS